MQWISNYKAGSILENMYNKCVTIQVFYSILRSLHIQKTRSSKFRKIVRAIKATIWVF